MRNVSRYSRFAKVTAHVCGRPRVFALARVARKELAHGLQDTGTPEP